MRLIDADALKYAIVEEGQRSRRYKLGDFWELNGDEIRNVIDAQPTIKPERKIGTWIERGLSGMVCSSCGYEYECKGTDSENYCPNCGSYNGDEGNCEDNDCPNCSAEMVKGGSDDSAR